jgi:drug/metabolite transporter (DMT)-like permease
VRASVPATSVAPPPWLVWAALLVIYVVWGSTYLAIKIVVDTMPPFLAGGARFVTAGLILCALQIVRDGGSRRLRITRAELAGSAVVGALLLLLGNGLVSVGEQEVPSGLAALIIGIVPLNVLVLRAIAGERVTRLGLAGVALGFFGLAVLVVPRGVSGSVAVTGMLVLVASSVAWSIGSFASRKLALPSDPIVSTSYQLVLGGAFMLVAGMVTGEAANVRVESFSTGSIVSLVYLITFGSLLAYTAYTWLLQNAPISKVATYAYVNPVVAVFLGWLVLAEEVNLSMLVGAALIVAAVALIVWAESRAGPSSAERASATVPPEVASAPPGAPAAVGSPRAVDRGSG